MGTPSPEPWRWRLVWLLFLATMLNYMDRQALSQTSTFLLNEFQVPAGEREAVYGRVEAAFAYSFALFQLFAGVVADRVSLRWLYLFAIVVWSAAGAGTGLIPAGALGGLMVCRVLLGFGEAFNWPCALAAVRRVIPRESWAAANGLFHSGASVGAVATPLLVLAVVDRSTGEGWRNVFVGVGLAGAAWAALWLLATRGPAGEALRAPAPAERPEAGDSFWGVFAGRKVWIMLTVGCSVNLTWHFFRTWFVRYLGKDLSLGDTPEAQQAAIQWLTAGFFIAADVGAVLSGFTIRGLTRRGRSVERSRQWVHTGLAAVALLAIPATQLPGTAGKMALFFAVAAATMGGFAVYFSLIQDVHPRFTALLTGIGGSLSWFLVATANGVVGPWADQQGTFVPAIIAVSVIPCVGAAAGWLWPSPVLPPLSDSERGRGG